MRISQRTAVFFLVLVAMIPAFAFAQGRGRLVGKVVDPKGNAIQGVTVTVTSPDNSTFRDVETTDKRGAFLVDFKEIDVVYRYRFEKIGYETLEIQQKWTLDGTDHLQWTLQPATKTAVGGAVATTTSQPAAAAFNAGVTAFKSKDYATAEAKFKEAVQADPKLVAGWMSLASVQLLTGHNQEAAEAAEKAIALGSTDEAVMTARWQAYRNLKDDAKAAEALKDLEKVGRRAEEAKKIHNEAVALEKAGDNAGAFAKFQEALNIDPNLQASQIGLATAALKLGKNAEAVAAAEAVLKNDPKNQQALRLRYNASLALGDKDRLFDALVGLADAEPATAAKGMLALAFEAYDANNRDVAKARFQKVLEVDPNQPLAHYYLALVLVNEGNTADAVSHLEKFVALAPNSKEAETAREMLKALKK
jgi:tetratricopeptide (TPR) repeat protein